MVATVVAKESRAGWAVAEEAQAARTEDILGCPWRTHLFVLITKASEEGVEQREWCGGCMPQGIVREVVALPPDNEKRNGVVLLGPKVGGVETECG